MGRSSRRRGADQAPGRGGFPDHSSHPGSPHRERFLQINKVSVTDRLQRWPGAGQRQNDRSARQAGRGVAPAPRERAAVIVMIQGTSALRGRVDSPRPPALDRRPVATVPRAIRSAASARRRSGTAALAALWWPAVGCGRYRRKPPLFLPTEAHRIITCSGEGQRPSAHAQERWLVSPVITPQRPKRHAWRNPGCHRQSACGSEFPTLCCRFVTATFCARAAPK